MRINEIILVMCLKLAGGNGHEKPQVLYYQELNSSLAFLCLYVSVYFVHVLLFTLQLCIKLQIENIHVSK